MIPNMFKDLISGVISYFLGVLRVYKRFLFHLKVSSTWFMLLYKVQVDGKKL